MNIRVIIKEMSVLICVIFFITSCDCFRHGNGNVLDSNSEKPLDSVLVEAYLIKEDVSLFIGQMYTDTSGTFTISTGAMGKFGCDADYIFLFSKKGYNNVVVKNPINNKIILYKTNYKREYWTTIYER